MMVTLFSVSFTSCIDNEVSPVVEAIYGAQADLLAAQAGVQNAEAAYLLAQANAENAYAAWQTAQAAQVAAVTAGIVADNAYEALQHEQDLRALVASTDLAVENAQNALALAQVQFEADMAAAIAAMEAAGAQVAVGYAIDYRNAMWVVNNLKSDKLALEGTLANKQLMLNGSVTWEFYLEGLNSDLSDLNASVAAKQAAIAAYEAYLLDPNTPEAQITAMEAQIAALEEANHDMDVQIEVINNQIQDVFIQMGETSDVINQHNFWTGVLNFHEGLKEGYENDNIALQEDIDDWQLALDDYPAAIEAAELAVSDAEIAQTAAQTAVDDAIDAIGVEILPAAMAGNDAIDPAVTLYEILWNADLAVADAQADFDALELEVNALFGTFQAAIDALALAQSNFDAGIDAIELAVTDAQTDLDNAELAWTAANNYYLSKKSIFEGAPSGLTWFDQTTPLGGSVAESFPAFPNTRIGIHTDAIATSYAYVTGWVEAPVGTWTATTISAGMVTAIPGTAFTYTGPELSATMPSVSAATGFYVELEADDLSETNADLLDDAVAKLGNDIAVDPVLGDLALLTTDAYSVVWNAQLALLEAQDVLANFGTAKDDAYAVYIYQKGLYENQVDLMNAAQTALDDAEAAQGTAGSAGPPVVLPSGALGDIANAEAALGAIIMPAPLAGDDAIDPAETLYEVLWNADLAVLDAEAALAALEVCDATCLQSNIDDANDEIAQNNLLIAEEVLLIAHVQADLDGIEVAYQAALSAPLNAALFVEFLELVHSRSALQDQQDANDIMADQLQDVIDAMGNGNLDSIQTLIDDCNDAIAILLGQIEAKEVQIAQGEVSVELLNAEIANIQAQIATLTVRIANAQAIADKYKALMDAALAS